MRCLERPSHEALHFFAMCLAPSRMTTQTTFMKHSASLHGPLTGSSTRSWMILFSQITQTILRLPLKHSLPLHYTNLDMMEIVQVSRVFQTGLVSCQGSFYVRSYLPS